MGCRRAARPPVRVPSPPRPPTAPAPPLRPYTRTSSPAYHPLHATPSLPTTPPHATVATVLLFTGGYDPEEIIASCFLGVYAFLAFLEGSIDFCMG